MPSPLLPPAAVFASIVLAAVVCAAVFAGALFYSAPDCEGDTAATDINCASPFQHSHDSRFSLLQHSTSAVSAATIAALSAAVFSGAFLLILVCVHVYLHV